MQQRAATTPTTVYAEPPAAAPSLLDAVLDATGDAPAQPSRPAAAAAPGRLDDFLRETDLAAAVGLWLGSVPDRWRGDLKGKLVRRLNADVARIDELLNAQLNAVLHHPAF